MKHVRLGFLLLALIAGCAVSASTAAKITVDPNSGSLPSLDMRKQPDLRLAQKISYTAQPKMVSQVLDDLSKLTGVKLRAGYNNQDWQVRDRKMVILARDVTLAQLMNSIARVMKFSWQKSDEVSPPAYRLYMNRKLLLEANKLLREQNERVRQHLSELRARTVGQLIASPGYSEQQMAKLRDENPYLYECAMRGVGKPFSALMDAAPEVHSALLAGDEVRLRVSSLTSGAQQALLELLGAASKPVARLPKAQTPAPADIQMRFGEAVLSVNESLSDIHEDPIAGRQYLGAITCQIGNWLGGVEFLNPEKYNMMAAQKLKLTALEEDRPEADVRREMGDGLRAASVRQVKEDAGGEPLTEHADDPDLNAQVKIKVKQPRLALYQKALSQESKFSVVSDYFGVRDDISNFPSGKTSIRTILDCIQDQFRYNWDKRDSVLEFRDRDWYQKRAAQIPEAWMDGWRKELAKTGTLDVESIAQMARLSPAQFWFNIVRDEVMGGDVWRSLGKFCLIGPDRDLMLAYGSLSAEQRALLFVNDTGLDSVDLSLDAQALVYRALSWQHPAFRLDTQSPVRWVATRRKAGKQSIYTFALTSEALSKPYEVKFTTPTYVPPKKEETPTETKAK